MTAVRVALLAALAAALLGSPRAHAQVVPPNGGDIQRGVLPERWTTGGPKCMENPEWQVHEYNRDLYILRQSGCTDFEKPFVYLIFGADEGLLLDTGSRNGNLAPALQQTVHRWLKRMSRDRVPLVVVHTHGHDDHVAGDADLLALNDPVMPVTLVPADVGADQRFFHIAHWPEDRGSVDLGDRVIDVLAIPGHAETSVAFYDRRTALLFTGDSLYPGRLYIHDLAAFQASTARLVRFTENKPVAYILGNHIEQTRTPFLDYPTGTMYQPDEHELPLSRGALLELRDALVRLHGQPARVALKDFTLWPSPITQADKMRSQKAFEQTQALQLRHQWDQPSP